MSKRYKVESYDAYDIPDSHWIKSGEFDTAQEALVREHRTIRCSLETLWHLNKKPDADGLMSCYRGAGEVPSIFGEPKVPFNAFEAVRWHIEEITGRQPSPDPEWVQRIKDKLNAPTAYGAWPLQCPRGPASTARKVWPDGATAERAGLTSDQR